MRRTQFIELLHTMGKTWVSFLSIVMFVTLGVGIFLGLSWTGLGVEKGADDDYAAYDYHDFDVSFPYGITEQDLADIAALDGVSRVEGGYTAYATYSLDGQGHVAHILSATENTDALRIVEGTAPVAADEMALDSTFAAAHGVKVGDTITFETVSANPVNGKDLLLGRTFTVTALAAHPAFTLASSSTRGMTNLSAGAADCFVVLPASAFDASAYDGCYSNAYVSCDGLASLPSFSDEYAAAAQTVSSELAALGSQNGHARYQSLYEAAQAQIDEGASQVAAGEQQIADGEQQIAAAESELEAALATLTDYQAQADEAQAQVDELLGAVADACINAGITGERARIVEDLRGLLDKAAASDLDVSGIAQKLGLSETDIAAYATEIQSALDGYRELQDKTEQLAAGWEQYNDGQAQLEQKKTELADGKVQLEAGKAQLEQAESKLAQLSEYGWSVSGRADNASAVGISSYHESTDRLRYSMALVFMVIGLLVCYTAVSRIVREQVVSIGTKKALGLRSREINLAYLLYSMTAVVIGVALAVVVAVIIQLIIASRIAGQFVLSALPVYVSMVDVLVIGVIELAFIGLATWFACRRMLKRRAVELLRGNEPPKNKVRFYEKWGIWNRMPLYSQSIVNNCFNDKTRVIGTIIGVAGCTALVVIAMTLYFNIAKTFDLQFEEVYDYTAHVSFDQEVQGAQDAIEGALQDQGARGTAVLNQTLGIVQPNGVLTATTVLVPEDADEFAEFYHLIDVSGGGTGALDDNGVWVSQAYAQHQGAKVGDMITLVDTSGVTRELPIAGVFAFHINHHEIVMSSALYEATFDVPAQANTVLVAPDGVSTDALVAQLQQVDGFFSYTDDYANSRAQFSTYQSLTSTVVYIYLGLSVLMALMVLMNLVVMFIDEKKREIIVLRINGFTTHNAKAYIYRDNIVLTVIGIVVGILLGMLMGYLSLLSVEFDAASYVHTPSLAACLIGAAVSALLAFAINLVALRRIPRFKLTDINKM